MCGKWTYGGGRGRSRSTTDLWIICTSEPIYNTAFRGGALRSSGRLHAIGQLGGHRSVWANVFLSFLPSFFLSFLMLTSLPACTGSNLGRPPCNTGLTQTDTYLWRKDHLILYYLLRWTAAAAFSMIHCSLFPCLFQDKCFMSVFCACVVYYLKVCPVFHQSLTSIWYEENYVYSERRIY